MKSKKIRFLKLGLLFFPIVLICIFFVLQVSYGFHDYFFTLLNADYARSYKGFPTDDLKFYYLVNEEDGPVENVTAIFLIIAGIIGFIIFTKFLKMNKKKFGFLFLFLAISFLVLGLEEISWGQRIFNFQTPELFSANVQGQFTIHNLPVFWTYLHDFLMMVGFVGAFGWIILRKIETRYRNFVRFFVPSWYLMFYFVPIFLFYFIGYFMPFDQQVYEIGDFLPLNDQEPPEVLMSIGILFFTAIVFLRQRKIFKSYKKTKPNFD